MALVVPQVKPTPGALRPFAAGDGFVGPFSIDPTERTANFVAAANYSYAIDVRGGVVRVTPAPGYVVGEAIMLCDSRAACSPETPITFVVNGTAYLANGMNKDVDLIIPMVHAVFRYRSALLGFVLEG